jgi:FkbM family methyltransferase
MNKEILKDLISLSNIDGLPKSHFDYLNKMKSQMNIEPKIIFDVGSCLGHWTKKARTVWSNSNFYLFDALEELKLLYDFNKYEYTIGVLSDVDNFDVDFIASPIYNNYNYIILYESCAIDYRDKYSEEINIYFNNFNSKKTKTITIDTIIKEKNYPKPDLIKIDVQGSELRVLKGMENALSTCNDIIIELQDKKYSKHGSIFIDINESINFIKSLGFEFKEVVDDSPYDVHFSKS